MDEVGVDGGQKRTDRKGRGKGAPKFGDRRAGRKAVEFFSQYCGMLETTEEEGVQVENSL
jgi:hypothetical protein